MIRKKVVITGCSSGFGFLMTKEALRKGWEVYATVRLERDRQHLYDAFAAHAERLRVEFLELCDEDSIASFATVLPDIDALINNAGVIITGTFMDLDSKQERQVFETNFFGPVQLTKLLIPKMASSVSPKIINISSLSGICGVPCMSVYSASKHALEGYFESLYAELKIQNISVVNILPGVFSTKMSKENLKEGSYVDRNAGNMNGRIYGSCKNGLAIFLRHSGDPGVIARKAIQVLESEKLKFRYFRGFGAPLFAFSEFFRANRVFRKYWLHSMRKGV